MRSRFRGLALAATAVAVATAAACSSSTSPNGGGGGGTGGHATTIVASSTTSGGSYGGGGNYFFNPTPDTVAVGSTVSWQFGSVGHNVIFQTAGAPANISVTSNSTVSRTFPTAGTYNYTCTIHGFSGVLVVK